MRAKVTNDHTVRTIKLDVHDTPSIDATRDWRRKPRVFRPDRAVLTVADGKPTKIRVFGELILKSGGTVGTREHAEWQAQPLWEWERITSAPDWVRLLWDEAPAGYTSWGTPPDA